MKQLFLQSFFEKAENESFQNNEPGSITKHITIVRGIFFVALNMPSPLVSAFLTSHQPLS